MSHYSAEHRQQKLLNEGQLTHCELSCPKKSLKKNNPRDQQLPLPALWMINLPLLIFAERKRVRGVTEASCLSLHAGTPGLHLWFGL